MCEDLRFSLDGMNDKVPGTSAAATPQETGDEPVQRPLATTTPSRPLLDKASAAYDARADFVFEKAMDKARDAVEVLVATQGGPQSRWRVLEARAQQRPLLREGP